MLRGGQNPLHARAGGGGQPAPKVAPRRLGLLMSPTQSEHSLENLCRKGQFQGPLKLEISPPPSTTVRVF